MATLVLVGIDPLRPGVTAWYSRPLLATVAPRRTRTTTDAVGPHQPESAIRGFSINDVSPQNPPYMFYLRRYALHFSISFLSLSISNYKGTIIITKMRNIKFAPSVST